MGRCLSVDGGGWRLPTLSELEGICPKENLPNVLKVTGTWVWAGNNFANSSISIVDLGSWPCGGPIGIDNESKMRNFKNIRSFAVRVK